MITCSAMKTMPENKDKLIVLQVHVPESFRTRLKMQSVRLGITMGDLLLQLTEQTLKKLEDKDR